MAHPILDDYDALLADLDGTVMEGRRPIDGAKEGLAGRRVMYVTNNASRSPQQVAEHLTDIGFPTSAEQVLTSAMAACDMAAAQVGMEQRRREGRPAPKAFVIGHDSFRDLAANAGFDVVHSADDNPDVVLHGHSPDNDWARLSEGALAIRAGAQYIASNLDTTLPSERGLLVGNGSMVAAVTSATGVTPHVAGKPGPAMFEVAARKLKARRPLAVGDRLDTDIAGGNAAGFDTLCTVTGVSGHWDILVAPVEQRPTFIAANMRDHLPGWSARVVSGSGVPGDITGSCIIEVSSGETQLPVTDATPASPNDSSAWCAVAAAEALAVAAPYVWPIVDEARGSHSTADARGAREESSRETLEAWGVKICAAAGDTVAAQALEMWR